MDKILEAKEVFISIAAHKLLTPLTLIKWNLELLKKDQSLSDSSKQKVLDIEESVKKLDLFSNILMKIVQTKADKGTKLVLASKSFILDINSILEKLRGELKTKDNINISVEIDDGASLVAKSMLEEKEVYFILQSILDNSVSYNEHEPKVKVNISNDEKNLIVVVEDNGIGVSNDELELVGEAFYRTSNSQKLSVKGFGLSLYMCKLILDNIKGYLKFESGGVNMGSKCIVYIPIDGK